MKKLLILISGVLILMGCSTNNNGTVTVIPLAPTNLSGSVISTNQINLSWTDNATNEDGYKVERKTGNGNYAVIGSMGANLSTYSDLGLTTNTAYTYRVYAYNSAGNSLQYSNELTLTTQDSIPSWLTNGLVGYWPFNGNANDESGNGNDGVVNGATLTSDRFGNSGKAYGFTGTYTNTETITGDCTNFPSGNSSRSISIWYFANNVSTAAQQVLGYGGGNCGESFIMNFNNYDVPSGSYEIQGHCIAFRNYASTPTPYNNTWHNLILTYDGSIFRFYNNGILVNTSAPTSINIVTSSKIFCFGKEVFTNGLSPYTDPSWPGFNGSLDDVRIYNRALTQSEVTYLATH